MKLIASLLLAIIAFTSCHLKENNVLVVGRDDTDVENLLLGLNQARLIDLCFEFDALLKKAGINLVGGPCLYLNEDMSRGEIVEGLLNFSRAWQPKSYDLLMKDWIFQSS